MPGEPTGPDPVAGVQTSEAARAALAAVEATSVIHPRALKLRFAYTVLRFAVVVLSLYIFVPVLLGRRPPELSIPFMTLLPLTWLSRTQQDTYRKESLPPRLGGRLALTFQAFRGEVPVPEPASWPRGSEAFALLSTAAATEGIGASWLYDRARLSPELGERWLLALTTRGLLIGGAKAFHRRWTPVRVTETGSAALAAERARLQALAAL